MLFNSFEFLIFVPFVFLLYWYLCRTRMQQNLLIVIASYVFYGWWDWRFLMLIAFTSLCSYGSGIAIGRYEGRRKVQKYISAGNLIINLLILCIFKYYNFFAESFAELFKGLGYQMDVVTIHIILPVGISFYTFQALSYSIDVYQEKIKPTRDIVQFFAYISFFPQLVAGPIERATNLLPQFQKERQFDYAKAVDGLRQMLWGFFKKLVVADNCSMLVNIFWEYDFSLQPGFLFILAGILFSFQIYCDFSGYSDIAIGCARLFGINLMRNFEYPYFSRSIPEFWRRWHISLMTWFRDYVYFPLGGSRCEWWKVVRNTFIVFFISGLWHGANWTFICWGLYHAFLIALFIMLGFNTKPQVIKENNLCQSFFHLLQITITFVLVVFGWILFRSKDLYQFMTYMKAIFNNPFWGEVPNVSFIYYSLLGFLLLGVEWLQRNKQYTLELRNMSDDNLLSNKVIRWSMYVLLYMFIVLSRGQAQPFQYFQF